MIVPLLPVCLMLLAMLIAGLGVAAIRMRRRQRRRRARAWRAYYQGGGLIRALMRRWPRNNRLTDQRRPEDRTS